MTTHFPKIPRVLSKPRRPKSLITRNHDAQSTEQLKKEFIDLMIDEKVKHAARNLASHMQ